MIAGSPAFTNVVTAHRVVGTTHGNAKFGRFKRDFLAALDGVPYFSLAGRGLTEHPGAGDVGLVAIDGAAAIHEDGGTCANRLRNNRTMRIRGSLVQQYQCE